ncbi:MAG: CHASE domain-containing protein [Planctomycetes bacterium]|nr:CHASE domain-containing protein [Planctomycetota bacterium]
MPVLDTRLRIALHPGHLPITAVAALGLGLALAAFATTRLWDQEAAAAAFTLAARDRVSALRATVQSYLEQMETLGEFYASSPSFDRSGWKTFAAPKLLRHSGISSLEWIPRVPEARRQEYEEAARKDGYPAFQFTQRLRQGVMIRAAPSAEYFPVYYQEPLVGNGIALGFDLGSEPKRRAALERARDTGRIVTTDRIILVEETSDRYSVLLFRPVYARASAVESVEERPAALQGFVLGVFRIGDLAEEALGHLEPQGIDVTLLDASAADSERYLYHSAARAGRRPGPFLPDGEAAKPGLLRHSATLEVGGRQWRVVAAPGPEYRAEEHRAQPWWALVSVLVCTAAFVAHMLGNLRRSERIERLVLERTAELREANESLRQAVLERTRAEEQLRAAHDALELRVAQRTAELTRANELLLVEIEERKRLEERLLQSQKMESIGRLAGGVAHEFNNLLTAVLGYAELAAGDLRPEDPVRDHLAHIRRSAERGASLTQQLLAFARRQMIEPKRVQLNDLTLRMESLLRHLLGEDYQLLVSRAPDLGEVRADPGQLEQVVLNLVMNARDAMPKGGQLRLETSNVVLGPEEAARFPDLVPGPYVSLAVVDTGVGMSEKVLKQLFEPFFTTKGPDKGTGLGLATCYGIVRQNNGHIGVTSEPGKGSTFRVLLPRGGEHGKEEPPVAVPAPPPGGSETVLLVEDEPMVRAIAGEGLRQRGYTVLEAVDGEDGLRVARAHAGALHLLLTDVVMPRLGGRELADQLLRERKELRVLYVSGYTREAIDRHGVLAGGLAFLQKPFRVATLASKVREILDAPRGGGGVAGEPRA